MPSTGGFQFTPDDLAILQAVFACRVVRIDDLAAITGRSHAALYRRIAILTRCGYLTQPLKLAPPHKHLFSLGRSAAAEIVRAGITTQDFLNHRPRERELSELFLRHFLMGNDVYVALTVAARRSGHLRLAEWQHAASLYDSVTVQERGHAERVPVRPDKFFVIEDTQRAGNDGRFPFMLETDRSTTTHARFFQKLKGYWHYFQQGRHVKRYGAKIPRVLTVTLTRDRASNLAEDAERIIPRPGRAYYLFTSLQELASLSENILAPICRVPHSRAPLPLLPHLEATGITP